MAAGLKSLASVLLGIRFYRLGFSISLRAYSLMSCFRKSSTFLLFLAIVFFERIVGIVVISHQLCPFSARNLAISGYDREGVEI